MGGADKGLDTKELEALLPAKTKKIFLLPGSGGEKMQNTKINLQKVANLHEAVSEAIKQAKKRDIILFSPAFASFNMFQNEYDRGDKFMEIVKELK